VVSCQPRGLTFERNGRPRWGDCRGSGTQNKLDDRATLLPRLGLAVCYAQALVLFHAVVFHVILLHFVFLGLFRLLALHFVLAHIVFLSLILAHVVFHLVLLGLVLFHALGGSRGRNR
jgi:hypothetical protein